MIFNFNKNKEITQLKAQIEILQKENNSIQNTLEEATQSNSELTEKLYETKKRYQNQEELNQLWLQSSDLVNQIRESLAQSTTAVFFKTVGTH